ncbi:MAG: class II aldolase/adducin family protein [Bacteroidales bacterium]|jgi:L-ribulose-5-phosphate 4-epimerase|nr:class II aldolase/adducin family protein [Bacteroidales bacterium]
MTDNSDEGYIKFHYDWIPAPILDVDIDDLIFWRQKLYDEKLIGSYPNGIGYGNISMRYKANQFIISASASGNIKQIDASHFALVDEFDLDKNWLSCIGNLPASSESLSHAAIYSSSPKILAILHIHHKRLWNKHLYVLPTTSNTAEYGTAEMAYSIQKLIIEENKYAGIIVMGGHEDGLLIYAPDLNQAGELTLSLISSEQTYQI